MIQETQIHTPQDERGWETNELDLLIGEGQRFTIRYTARERTKGWKGFLLGQTHRVEREETFTLYEPTLATLDRLSRVWISLRYDEEALQEGGETMWAEAKRLPSENARSLARVVAIAVLGEAYTAPEAERLEALFFQALKPSQLLKIAHQMTSLCNLGDFIASIRLMSATRTTQKTDRVE